MFRLLEQDPLNRVVISYDDEENFSRYEEASALSSKTRFHSHFPQVFHLLTSYSHHPKYTFTLTPTLLYLSPPWVKTQMTLRWSPARWYQTAPLPKHKNNLTHKKKKPKLVCLTKFKWLRFIKASRNNWNAYTLPHSDQSKASKHFEHSPTTPRIASPETEKNKTDHKNNERKNNTVADSTNNFFHKNLILKNKYDL